jgi:hypothetical protein
VLVQVAPEPALRAHLERTELFVDMASGMVPGIRRCFLLARAFGSMWRYPRPWRTVTDCDQCAQMAHEVADQRAELISKLASEVSWFELGDPDARRRMEAMESAFPQTQEVMLAAHWAIYLVRILCEAPEEQAWARADDLVAQMLRRTSSVPATAFLARGALGRLALVRGELEKAEELSREAAEALLPIVPCHWVLGAPVHVRALLGLGRAAEACAVAEQIVGVLTKFGTAGSFEVEARVAVTEAFESAGDHARARAELAETLRQIQLRHDDIADPFWKNSYLTRNAYVARALALGQDWGVAAGPSV